MEANILEWVGYLWIVFVGVWGVAAFAQKPTLRRDSGGSRFIQLILGAVAAILLFDKRLAIGFLQWPFVPNSAFFSVLGLAFMIAGISFALCARFFLGRNWSGTVSIKKDHELVCTGPYSVVRHPIYTGVLFALLGTAIVFGQIRGLLAVAVAALVLYLKSRREELFMTELFGAEYARYKHKVKRLIPFMW